MRNLSYDDTGREMRIQSLSGEKDYVSYYMGLNPQTGEYAKLLKNIWFTVWLQLIC